MIPEIVKMKNQKNCLGSNDSKFPKNAGAESTYKNMPLNGTPLAKASRMKRPLEPNSA